MMIEDDQAPTTTTTNANANQIVNGTLLNNHTPLPHDTATAEVDCLRNLFSMNSDDGAAETRSLLTDHSAAAYSCYDTTSYPPAALPRSSFLISNKDHYTIRISIGVFFMVYMLWRIIAVGFGVYFYFLSDWSFFLVGVYFLVGAYNSRPLCTGVFWLLLAYPLLTGDFLNLVDKVDVVIGHSISIILPVMDFVLSSHIIEMRHLRAPLLITILYSFLIFLAHFAGLPWPYPFIADVQEPNGDMNWFGSFFLLLVFLGVVGSLGLGAVKLSRYRNKILFPRVGRLDKLNLEDDGDHLMPNTATSD